MEYNPNWKEQGSQWMTHKVYYNENGEPVEHSEIEKLTKLTVIEYIGHYQGDLKDLYKMLTEYTLDPRWNPAIQNIDKYQWYAGEGAYRFHGNFLSYSYAFWVDTNDPEVCQQLNDLIYYNHQMPEYKNALAERQERERAKNDTLFKKSFCPVTC